MNHRIAISAFLALSLLAGDLSGQEPPVDMQRARELLQRVRQGDALSAEEQAYLDRARSQRQLERQRQDRRRPGGDRPDNVARPEARASTGLVPLTDLQAGDRYQGEDGGLYGNGSNEPPQAHRAAADSALAQIRPLNAQGQPAADGHIVLLSISMSNATQEFSVFKRLADASPAKSERVVVVDGAQGGQAMAEWAQPEARPWAVAMQRLETAGVSPHQVQAVWVKLANKGPSGDLEQHGRKLEADTLQVLHNAREKFPNLRVAYLSTRTYAGYAIGGLNPEPYAYESAYVARWLILRQIEGDPTLNHDPERGAALAPLLLWGPYLWADGEQGRQLDDLVWLRNDFVRDGVHPSDSGRRKVADLLLEFFNNNALAGPWFTGQP